MAFEDLEKSADDGMEKNDEGKEAAKRDTTSR